MPESRAAPIAGACRNVPQSALSKQSRHKRRLQASSSTYTLKREKFRETMYCLEHDNGRCPGCDYTKLSHFAWADIVLCHYGIQYPRLVLVCDNCYISYRRGLYCCSFSSIGHFLTASECGSDNGRFTLFLLVSSRPGSKTRPKWTHCLMWTPDEAVKIPREGVSKLSYS